MILFKSINVYAVHNLSKNLLHREQVISMPSLFKIFRVGKLLTATVQLECKCAKSCLSCLLFAICASNVQSATV